MAVFIKQALQTLTCDLKDIRIFHIDFSNEAKNHLIDGALESFEIKRYMEKKIIYMYAEGMTMGDMESHMWELYDLDIPDSKISRITDKILPIVKEWQVRCNP